MKLALKELLTEQEVQHFTSLGLAAELEIEKEISTKAFIEMTVKAAVDAAVAELRTEIDLLKAAPETEAEESEQEEETKEEEAGAAKEEEAKAEETQTEEDDTIEFKALQEELDKLKALLSEEK